MAKKTRKYLKASELATLRVGDSVRPYRHERRPNGHVDVLRGEVTSVGRVERLRGAVIVEDRLGAVIGATNNTALRLERV